MYQILYNIIYYVLFAPTPRQSPTIHTRTHIHPAGTMRESLFIHTAGGIAIQDYVPGLF